MTLYIRHTLKLIFTVVACLLVRMLSTSLYIATCVPLFYPLLYHNLPFTFDLLLLISL